jgi:hypothetical protein
MELSDKISFTILAAVFSTAFELRGADLPFENFFREKVLGAKNVLLLKFDGL